MTLDHAPAQPPVTRLYFFLLAGELISVAVLAACLWVMRTPLLVNVPIVGIVASALGALGIAEGFIRRRPKIPPRDRRQPLDEFWGDERTRLHAAGLWLSLVNAGMVALVGFFLTGSRLAGGVTVVAIALLLWMRPAHLDASEAV